METCATMEAASEEWTQLLDASDDAWLYHTLPWLEMTAAVYTLENWFFEVRDAGILLAAFPVQRLCYSRYARSCDVGYSGLMGSAGPLIRRDLSAKLRRKALAALTGAIQAWAKEMQVDQIQCSLPPLAATSLANIRGINPLSVAGWADVSTHTRLTALTIPDSELWRGLADDARRSVRRAQSTGYTVTRENWGDCLEEYYQVHQETYKRTGVPPHPKAYFVGIAAEIAARGQAVLWVGRDPVGRAVAFHNDARYREGSLYWTGCCETEHLESGINYLLFWQALAGAKEDGCRWYEIGEAFPGVTSGKLHGLTVFKAKFGGELYRYYRGELCVFSCPPVSFKRRLLAKAGRPIKGYLRKLMRR
jgi:hypothetical protein